MGSQTEIVQAPTPAAAPSTAEAVNAWVNALPQIYETQMAYAPMEAQQQLQLLQDYALPMAQAYQESQEALYPGTTSIQENLASQALEGMESGVPQWMEDEYLDAMRANLGTNVGSQIGADYTATGLMNMKQDWQNYYRNLGLTLSGRQPLAQPVSPTYSNYMSGFTPGSAMQYELGGYNAYQSAARPLGYVQNESPWVTGFNTLGNIFQGVGSMIPK